VVIPLTDVPWCRIVGGIGPLRRTDDQRQFGEEGGTDADQDHRPEAGLLAGDLTLQADHGAQDACDEEPRKSIDLQNIQSRWQRLYQRQQERPRAHGSISGQYVTMNSMNLLIVTMSWAVKRTV
jgi:hypothetical protein